MIVAASIMIVDDEPHIRLLLRTTLSRAGYRVHEASSAKRALELLSEARPDAVLLDLGLPDRDGLELVPLLKMQTDAAVLVVSARNDTDQKVAALDLGADDYITKPFDTHEVLARLRAALRHRLNGEGSQASVRAHDLEIDLVSRRVTRDGAEVKLTPKERSLLVELAKAPGRATTHVQLLARLWPDDEEHHVEYLRAVVRNLRQKIEADASQPKIVISELGIGYRLATSDAAA